MVKQFLVKALRRSGEAIRASDVDANHGAYCSPAVG
jgi:hypothetical protein